jgi:phage FluMu protein Com
VNTESNTNGIANLSGLREMILRNCNTDFYGDEILGESHKFDAAYFQSVREGGYTAIWIRGQLRDLVVFDEAPHWNNRNPERIEALQGIVARGLEEGVKVFLYINEPKGFMENEALFEKYPDLKGPFNPLSEFPLAAAFEPKYAFCTQSAFAETYLVGGFQTLFAQVPDLAGVLTITASEILSHCYSNVDVLNLLNEDFKHKEIKCPRCKSTTAIATVIDVIEKIRKGIRASSETAKVVAWNWSWGMYEVSPQREIIGGLSKDVIIMCDMQRGGSKTVEGIDLTVDEYSFSYLGPSPLFIDTVKAAAETGHEMWAKIMVNVTHEFLVVPYLPLPFRLAKKMIPTRDLGSRGLMGCWNYGGDASTWMAQLGSKIFHDDNFALADIDPEVRRISTAVYGTERADAAYRAWEVFDKAFEYFPFDLFLIYYGPHMHGTGFEWVFTREEIPMPWYFQNAASRRGTALGEWCPALSPQNVILLFEKLTDEWKPGLHILAEAFGIEDPFDAIPEFDSLVGTPGFEDFNIARTIYLHFLSTVGFVKFRLATLEFFENPDSSEEQKTLIRELMEIEKPRIRAMSQVVGAYPRIPVAEEAQKALYTVDDLTQKLASIDSFSFEEGQSV